MKINAPISLNERERAAVARITSRIPRIKIEFGGTKSPPVEPVAGDPLAEFGPAAERHGFIRKWLRS